MKIAFYSSKPTPDGKGLPTFAFTFDDKDGKGGEFDRFRIYNDDGHVEISIRGKVVIENQEEQTIIRLLDRSGDFIVRQR
jgi:hypothetical protein